MSAIMQPYLAGLGLVGLNAGLAKCTTRLGLLGVGFHLESPIRRKSQSHDKIKTGKAIKQLNKENKYLFGELLNKAKPSKTKRRAVIKQSSCTRPEQLLGLDGIQSELLWYKQNNQLDSMSVSDGEQIHNIVSISYNEIDERSLDAGLCLRPSQHSLDLLETNDTILSSAAHGLGLEEEMCTHPTAVITRPRSPSPIPEADLSKPSLELPDIIIRNITSFPLFNNKKIIEDQTSQEDNILNISRDNSTYFTYPSVTKILNATMSDASRAALARWRQKMVAELGEEGFLKYSNDLLLKGSEFHRTIHDHLSGVPSTELQIDTDIKETWRSLSPVIPDVTNVKVLESHVVHPELMYRGVIDCVANYKGKMAVLEWKKSDKQKKILAYTYDAPLQLVAYLGAINYDPNYHFKVRGGVVVVAYTDGTPAQVFKLTQADCAHYWSLWLQRLHQYWQQQRTSSTETAASALPLPQHQSQLL